MNDYHSRCATDDSRIGVALGEYQAGNVGVSRVEICSRERPAVSIVAQWLAGATEAPLAIDAPLGWPASLARALGGHPVGAAVTDGLRGQCHITVVI